MLIGHRGGVGGESTYWAEKYIGCGNALVDIHAVMALGAFLPFQRNDFGPRRITFGDLMRKQTKVVAVNTSQLVVSIRQEEVSVAEALAQQRPKTSCLRTRMECRLRCVGCG